VFYEGNSMSQLPARCEDKEQNDILVVLYQTLLNDLRTEFAKVQGRHALRVTEIWLSPNAMKAIGQGALLTNGHCPYQNEIPTLKEFQGVPVYTMDRWQEGQPHIAVMV
jgi:hypothetical protein